MALIHSFEKSGNWLFRRRGQMPVLLFIIAVPAIYGTDYASMKPLEVSAFNYSAYILSLTGLLIRAYTIGTTSKGTSGRNTRQQVAEQLNVSGIYSMVRHPLYLGNYLMWIGIVVFTKNFSFIIAVSLLYWLYYERIMFAEERFLERKFGQQYLDWSQMVPAFLPKFSGYTRSDIPFSFKSILRREYSGGLAMVTGFVFVELIINYRLWETWYLSKKFIWVFAAAIAVTLVLRSLKHYTRLLDEEGRS